MNSFRSLMEWVGIAFDATGVAVIAIGALAATWRRRVRTSEPGASGVRQFRQEFGGAIVLGLEFLVAGDIIRTVVVAPTLENVAVLAIIVLVRIVLSLALQIEIEGRWPWQGHGFGAGGAAPCTQSTAATAAPRAHPEGTPP
ncbi:MAG: DUF1622 domain-containing protein [Nevskia sp.]|nr:DUF1622 domain-containing protein [Nevskia sp.]